MSRSSSFRGFLRLTRRLEAQLAQNRVRDVPLLPEADWSRLQRLAVLLDLAARRGWPAAERWLRREIGSALWRLAGRLRDIRESLVSRDSSLPRAQQNDIVRDLLVLGNEFESVTADLQAGTLAVTTDAVVLNGDNLGPFRIVLLLDRIGTRFPYQVIALEPRPARSQPGTTHPHVQFDTLCEGEGSAAIRAALTQGRVFDFFVLIRQVLRTYCAETAYVTLDEWQGRDCADCGSVLAEGALRGCERCDAVICPECALACDQCRRTCCSRCRSACGDCDDPICDRCARKCADCGEWFCAGCLAPGACLSCRTSQGDSS